MFYRRESSTVPLGMLADLADITCTPAEFGRIELGYIRKCAGEFANFSYLLNEAISSRGLDKDNPVIGVSFPTFGEQVSILGMLELLATSNEQICEQYLPLCTQALNFISHIDLIIEEDGYGSYGILSELDSFLFELCSRIFRISVEFPTWSMKLTTSVWKWTSDLHQQINDTAEPFHIRLAVAALIGIYRAFNIHSANTVLVDSTQLKMLAELNFSEDKISLAAKAWSRPPKNLGFSTGATKESDWRQWIIMYSNTDQGSLSELASLVEQTAVLCAIYDSSLHEPLISKLVAILEDHTVNYDSTSLDLLLTAIEGLEIMAVSSNTTASSVTHSLITFLVQPANIFLALSDEYMCAILRECACRSLSNILSCRVDANQRKTALYTFTIDVAIPALARRLDDSQTIFDEFIWKNLGNIGLTDDIEVFRHIVTFIIDYSKRTFSKISKISHTLARMPGRSAALQEIYLEKLLVLFLEKASSLQRTHTDPTVISELRDIMSIVKHLVRVVASKTPPLILDRQRRSLEADLGANSIMQGAFPETVMAKIKNLLVTMFPARIIELRSISFQSSVYLLTVYHIESLRIRTQSVDFIYRYLVDERLYNTDIYTVLETIADEVLRLFMHSQSFSDVDTHVIEHNMQCMLLYSAHRLSKPRKFATRWILHMLDAFPSMIWNHKVAFLMMDILRYLDTRKAGISQDGFKNPLLSKLFFLDEEEAASASADYIGVGEAWFKAAIKRSVYETIGIVQTYLIEISNKSPYTALNDHSNLMVLLSRYTGISEIASTIIKSPSKHSRLGPSNYFKKISTSLKSGLRNTYRTTDEPNFAQRLNHSLFRAVALIISNPNLEAELLQLVCRVPNVMFDQTVMEIAVAAWGWLMSSQPDITKRVISYLIQAWELTINSGQGLYGIESGITSPFIEKLTYGAPVPSDTVADDSDIYSQFFEIAARSQHTLSSNWTAREARFALASLGIRVALDLEAASDRGAPYIWTLVFNITLSWFERPPMFGRIKAFDLKKLAQFYYTFKEIKFGKGSFCASSRIDRVLLNNTGSTSRVELSDAQNLVALLLEHEISRLSTWVCPLEDGTVQPVTMQMPPPPNERQIKWASIVRTAWSLNPVVAVQLSARFVTSSETIESEISEISKYNEISCINCSEAATLFLKNAWRSRSDDQLRYLLYWTPVPPIQAIAMLSHSQRIQPWVLQYAVRVLEFFPIDQRKIDERMRKIKVQVGVYLPNEPRSIILDIDYDSGRPLQSHAKVSFPILDKGSRRRLWLRSKSTLLESLVAIHGGCLSIFKSGTISDKTFLHFTDQYFSKAYLFSAGLDLYTFPYRVVATAPGCGVH
ncbi:hypothetical protein BASA81_016413 [Batrachochytrium salamandrivorans]|nr:hypothetical protein BASA81_016413 [Batrachochytrium salamandrivorans]